MSPRPMQPEERQALRGELLDYLYGCAEDAARLERRIASEPEVAALLEEARATKHTLDEAARDDAAAGLGFVPPAGGSRVAGGQASPRGRLPRPILGAAALLLLAPWCWTAYLEARRARVEDGFLRLVVSGPSAVPDGAPARVHVETWDQDGEPEPAEVVWRALDERGATLREGRLASSGSLDFDVPADLAGVRSLSVRAQRGAVARESSLVLLPGGEAPLVHLACDKPLYRPGETVWLRATALDRLSLHPRTGRLRARVVDPKGALVQALAAELEDGVAPLSWVVPEEAVGGEYALEIRDGADAFTVERLPFEVRRYQPPRLAKTVDLDRKSYAPGERGAAEVRVERVEGGAAAGAQVSASLVVDGDVVWSTGGTLDAQGRATFSFQVPGAVERGEARFVARVADGGVVETEVEPFVIPTGELSVDFYPEGGELVAGARVRVYAEVTDTLDRPVDARGRVVDGAGREVARFETEHQGRARFELVPRAGERYRLELVQPEAPPVDLPAVVASGVALRALSDGLGPRQPLELEVETPSAGPWIAGVFCRGRLVAQDTFQASGHARVALALPDEVAGVLRVTVFDRELRPVAERLVHRTSGRAVRLEVTPARERILPGEHQAIDVRATDEEGRPVPAVLGISVADRAVRDLAGEPRAGLADRTWLLADVEELEDVGEFLDGDPDAARHVDLLLGTRGWRRFAWLDPEALVAERGEEAQRLLLLEGRVDRPQVQDVRGDDPVGLATVRRAARRARDFAWLASWGAAALLAGWAVSRLPRPVPQLAGASLALGIAVLCWNFAARRADSALPAGAEFAARGDAAGVGGEALRGLGYLGGETATAEEPPVVEALALGKVWNEGMPAPGAAPVGGAADERAGIDTRLDFGLADAHEDVALAQFDDKEVARDARRLNAKTRVAQPVRVYAHRRAPRPADAPRVDFSETVYWNALLATSPDGRARFEFDTSDLVTIWRVDVDAHGAARVGQAQASFEAVPAFHMEAKLPVELSAGDRLLLPVALSCEDPSVVAAEVVASASGPLRLDGEGAAQVPLLDGRGRVLLPIAVTGAGGAAELRFAGNAGGFGDRVGRELRVVPRGFPRRVSRGGRVVDRAEFTLGLPAEAVEGSLALTLKLYPSPLAGLLEGLEGILQEPHGCFEQASATHYPNVLAAAYLDVAGVEAPAAMARARELMETGLARLVGYECSERGFEWFGGNPGHEALTAYGLLEFADTARVFPVDDGMVARTRGWLLARRDGKGGYARSAQAVDSYGRAPQAITDTYCTYGLVLSGTPAGELGAELDRLAARALEVDDAYEVALAAAALEVAGRGEVAEAARERLKGMQRPDGSLAGGSTSITCSGGNDLAVETTSLAILAWLADPGDEAAVRQAVEWLLAQRQGSGRFGATQATVQALRALTEVARSQRRVAHAGELVVLVDDFEVARVAFEAGRREPIEVPGLLEALHPGDNRVRLELSGGNEFPWAADLVYFAETPADDPDAPIAIEVALDGALAVEGETVAVLARVTNLADEGQPMTLARIGLPAGLSVPTKVLEDLQAAGRFDLWERAGREVILYWRDLAPREEVDVSLDCVAEIPGTTEGPASRVYRYYTPELVRWAAPIAIAIDPER